MSETKWTPGPWGRRYSSIIDTEGKTLLVSGANVSIPCSWKTEESEANGNLIAAAPDLYEALHNLMRMCEVDGVDWPHSIGIAKDALAKARGEQ